MSYREKLRQYKEGKLSGEERKKVEADIERQDAISEYLMERLEEELDEGTQGKHQMSKAAGTYEGETGGSHKEDAAAVNDKASLVSNKNTWFFGRKKSEPDDFEESERKFQEYVRKSIHRSFRRMGTGIFAVLLAVICFIQFGLSPLIDQIYYNPAKNIEIPVGDGAILEGRMSRDLAIYSEVSLPGRNRDYVHAIPQGYGNYAITLNRSVTYAGTQQRREGGRISRNHLEIYDGEYTRPYYGNYFACYGLENTPDLTYEEQILSPQYRNQWFYKSLEDGENAIHNLKDDEKYFAYVTLQKPLDFQEMNDLIKRLESGAKECIADIWLGVITSPGANYINTYMGYLHDSLEFLLTEEEEKRYPYLSLIPAEQRKNNSPINWEIREDEAVMVKHFTSMLQYIADNEVFLKMMGEASGQFLGKEGLKIMLMNYRAAIDYVKENGLNYYGFTCLTTKADMLQMLEDDDILAIKAELYP